MTQHRLYFKILLSVFILSVLLHNNVSLDDCAYGITNEDFHSVPTAKINKKDTMGVKYYEAKIYWGFLEFLVVGGYFMLGTDNSFTPYLGSSISGWNGGVLDNGEVFFEKPVQSKNVLCTERLLNQYLKRDSDLLFGIHSMDTAIRGFTPITPLHFLDHSSQLNVKPKLNHFGSKLLYLFCCRRLVGASDVNELFKFFLVP